MKLQALLDQLYHQPALITPQAHGSIRQLLEYRLGLYSELENPELRAPGQGMCGEAVEVEQAEVIGGIMHIPINGVLGQKLDPFQRGEGAVDTLDVMNEIDEAEADDDVRAVLFDVDSPGGMVQGTPELAARIAEMTKPCLAFTNGLMASAAYWVGSACNGIYATQTASLGSIGVYLPVMDSHRRFQQAGVDVDIIKAGKLKGAGFPGTELTPESRAHLQARVDEIHDMFKSFVREGRLMAGHIVEDDAMEGQTFMAAEAHRRGLIDGIVRNKADVLRRL